MQSLGQDCRLPSGARFARLDILSPKKSLKTNKKPNIIDKRLVV